MWGCTLHTCLPTATTEKYSQSYRPYRKINLGKWSTITMCITSISLSLAFVFGIVSTCVEQEGTWQLPRPVIEWLPVPSLVLSMSRRRESHLPPSPLCSLHPFWLPSPFYFAPHLFICLPSRSPSLCPVLLLHRPVCTSCMHYEV